MQRIGVFFTLLAICLSISLMAQVDPGNINLLGQYDDNTLPTASGVQYNDVWGYSNSSGEFAIVGNSEYILFLDVTDPANIPAPLLEFDAGNPEIWRDFKTFEGYVFGVCDSCSEGLHIFSTSGNTVTHELTTTEFFGSAHNIFIDVPNEILYAVGVSGSTDLIMIDISDPVNPALIKNVNFGSGFYVHDVFVKDNIAYCSHGWDDFYIWDMTDPDNPVELGSISTPNYNHSSWITKDGAYLYYAEEVGQGLPMTIVDLANMGDPVEDISVVGTFQHAIEDSGFPTPHNPYVVGDLLVISYYEDGVKIYDITDPVNPELVGQYDTHDNSSYSGTNGNWGVYPFLPSGNILATDIDNGLYVLEYVKEAKCDDGVINGDETGLDCGGDLCAPCDDFCFKSVVQGFDSGWASWVDGGSDCRRSLQDHEFAFSGNRCVRLRDNSSTSVVTSPSYSLGDISTIYLSFTYITVSMEDGESILVEVSTDDGANFSTVASYFAGTDFCDGEREYVTAGITQAFSHTTKFRIRCNASDNNDFVYIDDIVIHKCPSICTTVENNNWEAGFNGWSDDGLDCRRSNKDSAFANSGVYCVRIQDDTDQSSTTSKVFGLDGAAAVTLNFNYITSSMEAGESFAFEYSLDGGATWNTGASYESGVHFTNGIREFENESIIASFTEETVFRFRCYGSTNNDRVYLDDITIDACVIPPDEVNDQDEILTNRNAGLDVLTVYPNPSRTSNMLNIEISERNTANSFVIYDLTGNKITQQVISADNLNYTVDLSNFAKGTYIVQMKTKTDFISQKFVVLD